MNTLRDRVAALSDAQRAALAQRLGAQSDGNDARLVGYVVPREGALDIAGVRSFLRSRLPEHMVPALLVSLDALPRTPGGKLDTNALPDPDPAVQPATDVFVEPADAIETTLAAIWADVLGGVRVGVHDNFFEIGGDSILSIRVVARAALAGLRITPDQLFRHPTIAELAQVAGVVATRTVEDETLEGDVPLTPIQHWFFEQSLSAPSHWHHVVFIDAPVDLDIGRFKEALRRLSAHHDALRMRFHHVDGAWRQSFGPPDLAPTVETMDLSGMPADARDQLLLVAADALAAHTDLAGGPPVAALVALGAGPSPRIALLIHHLVVDPLSWQILIEDLDVVHAALEAGEEPALPARTTSFRSWANAAVARAASRELLKESAYWHAFPDDAAAVPRDLEGPFTEGSARTLTTRLDAEEAVALLERVPGAYGTRTDEVLLTALARAVSAWTNRTRLLVGIERHGRESIAEDLDLSRTVGWFTSFFPILLSLEGSADPGIALKAVKEQVRGVPGRGIGYGMLRYLAADDVARPLRAAGDPQILFNYGGRAAIAPARAGRFGNASMPVASRHADNRRTHALEINAFVADARLEVRWTYSANVHHATTITRLADRFMTELRALIAHCTSPGAGGFTPSDFPEAALSQAELDRFLRGLSS